MPKLLSLLILFFLSQAVVAQNTFTFGTNVNPQGTTFEVDSKGFVVGGKHVLPLYSRLILLNIRSDLKRVVVTIVSVAGCCALVVIGFTLKSAVEGALQKQYDRVVNYDGRIKFDSDAAENASAEIRQLLDSEGIDYTEFYDGVVTFRIRDILVGELLCGDISQISSFYHLLDWKTDEPLSPTDEGILIQKRTAESYDLKVGSELELTLANSRRATVRVAGIFDNYIGRVMPRDIRRGLYFQPAVHTPQRRG